MFQGKVLFVAPLASPQVLAALPRLLAAVVQLLA